jgi:hypothetical protein
MNNLTASVDRSESAADELDADWQNSRDARFPLSDPFQEKHAELRAREARIKDLVENPRRALREVVWLTPICGLTPMAECDECGFQDDEDGSLLPCDGRTVINLDAHGIFRAEEQTFGECPVCHRGTMVHLPFVSDAVKALRRQCLAWIQESKSRQPIDTRAGFEAVLKAAIQQGRALRSVEWDQGTHLKVDQEGRLRQITPDGEGSPTLLTAEAVLHQWQLV